MAFLPRFHAKAYGPHTPGILQMVLKRTHAGGCTDHVISRWLALEVIYFKPTYIFQQYLLEYKHVEKIHYGKDRERRFVYYLYLSLITFIVLLQRFLLRLEYNN